MKLGQRLTGPLDEIRSQIAMEVSTSVLSLNGTLTSGEQYYTNVQIISDFTRIMINRVILSTCICLLGIVGHCINITVFMKQGLRRSVNLSLCAMSFSDLFGLFFQVWQNFCVDPYLELADFSLDFEPNPSF
ncbi:hypothetical protein Btru_072370 [Bulinus truncatus]|nr:hypothetical protein Btru_072370 [Bulinus truncatus]